ncbi:hypothetical protein EAF00_011283 [Botryotinia globosa]|nr:hypothetical protein EAF00_011283 [Botryotinia globosa]
MSPPQISVDFAMTLLRNSDTNFLIGYKNAIPDPRYLTVEQRKDHTAATLGNPEPHKFILLHFKNVNDLVNSKQIIMHRYPRARYHNWDDPDDINKLNMFRIAAITFALTGNDISVGERCWSFVPKSRRRIWFPDLLEFVEERRTELAKYLAEAAIDEEHDGDDEGEGDGGDGDISSGYSEEFEPVAPSTTQAVDDFAEEQQEFAEADRATTPEASDDDDSSDQAAQTALASSSNVPVSSLILSPELNSASTLSGSPILNSPYIGFPIVDPQALSLTAEAESMNLDADPVAMDFELENSINNEGHGESLLL